MASGVGGAGLNPEYQFIVLISVSAVSGLTALGVTIVVSLLKNLVNRMDIRIAAAERAQEQDAKNLDMWKLTYVERHAEVRGRIASIEGMATGALTQLQSDVRKLQSDVVPELRVMCLRLDGLERAARMKNGDT